LKKFLAILGPSRSGTTLLAAVLHAHPDIEIRFEPWNSMNPKPPVFKTTKEFDEFFTHIYGKKIPNPNVIGFKETIGTWKALNWVENVLMHTDIPMNVIVILRNLSESYLSMVDGGKKWWNQPDLVASEQNFLDYIRTTSHAILRLNRLIERYGGAYISYKALTSYPHIILPTLMDRIGLSFLPEQLDYYKLGKRAGVMGDVGVAENPKPISFEIYNKRRDEAEKFLSTCKTLNGGGFNSGASYGFYKPTRNLISFVDDSGVITKIPDIFINGLNPED
jgi:hypothetical protein